MGYLAGSLFFLVIIGLLLFGIVKYKGGNLNNIIPISIAYSLLSVWVFFISRELDQAWNISFLEIILGEKLRNLHFLLVGVATIQFIVCKWIKQQTLLIVFTAISYFSTLMLVFTIYNFGIISFVWLSILSIAHIAYIYSLLTYNDLFKIIENKKDDSLSFAKEESTRNFKLGIQGLIALAASTGVSMSIIFRGGESSWHDDAILYDAFGMAIGLILVCIGVGFFLFISHYNLRQKIFNHYIGS